MTKALVREQKDFAFQVKEFDDATGTVKGYLSTFGNIDETGDRVCAGAFKRTLQSKYEYKKKHNKTYLMPLLWQHSTDEPIGGYTEAKEDSVGLYVEFQVDMDVQRGREAYSGLKKGYIFQQSIGYDTINSEWVQEPDGKMVRNLLELRLWEGSVVTFPANELAVVTSVKSMDDMEAKGVCGSTTLPLDDRDAAWDGSAAHNRVVDWASDSDGNIVPSKMKQAFFWCDSSEPDKIGSYKLIFADVQNGKLTAVPKGIFGCAGAIQGARGTGVDIPSGDEAAVKKRIETWYAKMAKKFDDDSIVAPWKDSGKARNRRMQTKTFAEHYAEEMCDDLLEDWCDVLLCAFTDSVLDACKIGDTIESDVQDALADFGKAVMAWVAQAQEYNLSDYLEEHSYSSSPAEYLMQYGSDSRPNYGGYMSNTLPRSTKLRQKAGRALSAARQAAIDEHVKNMKDLAKKAKSDMKAHVATMHDAIDGTGDDGSEEKKSAIAQAMQAQADKLHEHADKAMSIMAEHTKAVTSAANDFANAMQGAEKPAYGDGEGEADDDQQEGRGKSRQRSPYQKRTPAPQNERPRNSTALEDVEIPASWLDEIRLRKAV